jgi:hypothetical protein
MMRRSVLSSTPAACTSISNPSITCGHYPIGRGVVDERGREIVEDADLVEGCAGFYPLKPAAAMARRPGTKSICHISTEDESKARGR